jgi:hypothetical protein
MTREEFISKYRTVMLGFFAECWACRKTSASDMGMELDRQYLSVNSILTNMWKDASGGQQAPSPEALKSGSIEEVRRQVDGYLNNGGGVAERVAEGRGAQPDGRKPPGPPPGAAR